MPALVLVPVCTQSSTPGSSCMHLTCLCWTCQPDVLHPLLVQKTDTKKVSALDPDQLTKELLDHGNGLPLPACLPSAVEGQFPLGDVLVH